MDSVEITITLHGWNMFNFLHSRSSEVSAITGDIHIHHPSEDWTPNIHLDTSAPGYVRKLPILNSVEEAHALLDKLLNRPPQYLQCDYDLDDVSFTHARSLVLSSGVIALSVHTGHKATLFVKSAHIPKIHWQSEFVFRAASGITKLKPELSKDAVFDIVSGALRFCVGKTSEDV
jgi:hypothetical protein